MVMPDDVVERIMVARELYVVHAETFDDHEQSKRRCLGVFGRFEDAKRAVVDALLAEDLEHVEEYYDPAKRYRLAYNRWGLHVRKFWADRWANYSTGVAEYTVETWVQDVRGEPWSSQAYAFDRFVKTKIAREAMASDQVRAYLQRIRQRDESDPAFRELLSDELFVPELEPWKRSSGGGKEFEDERREWRRLYGAYPRKPAVD